MTNDTGIRAFDSVAILRSRATSLRRLAVDSTPLVARTFQRRASELELAAWVIEVGRGPTPDELAELEDLDLVRVPAAVA